MSPLNSQPASIAAAPQFADLTEATAPAAAKPLLAKAREVFGFVPNLAVIMAAEPRRLKAIFIRCRRSATHRSARSSSRSF